MDAATVSRSFRNQTLTLPGVYVVAVFLTTALSRGTPGGAHYRIFSVCPPVASLGMVVDNEVVIVGAFLLLGVPWWYLVGRIGWDAHERRRSLLGSGVGALIAGFTCFVSTGMTLAPLKQDLRYGAFPIGAISQYSLVALLCVGALLSTLVALITAVTPGRQSNVTKNILKSTITGIVAGVVLGWLLSLVSGNIFVVFMVGTLGLVVGGILGIVHRNDP